MSERRAAQSNTLALDEKQKSPRVHSSLFVSAQRRSAGRGGSLRKPTMGPAAGDRLLAQSCWDRLGLG
jgi:hypothetical protein